MGTKSKQVGSVSDEEKRCDICRIRLNKNYSKSINAKDKQSLKLMFGEIDTYRFRSASKEDCPFCNSTFRERLDDVSSEISKNDSGDLRE